MRSYGDILISDCRTRENTEPVHMWSLWSPVADVHRLRLHIFVLFQSQKLRRRDFKSSLSAKSIKNMFVWLSVGCYLKLAR